MSAVVCVEGVWKKYRRGGQTAGPRANHRDATALQPGEFWALRDVHIEARRGEAVGVIGPNGAGKSTLLKVLAGVVRPSLGRLSLHGRVSAMIELGAGFHPELSGRENIRLNAALRGMSQRELRRKLEAIIEFADIGPFLDMPVKHYSSGMQARLGFAVAAHVEPDVLLVDEVLSVGDRVFRSRCMERMRQFRRHGAAIVFVSHDLGAVGAFCDRVAYLARGAVRRVGSPVDAIGAYEADAGNAAVPDGPPPVRVLDAAGQAARCFAPGERIRVEFDNGCRLFRGAGGYALALTRAADGLVMAETWPSRSSAREMVGDQHVAASSCELTLNVAPGEYLITVHAADNRTGTDASASAARVVVIGSHATSGMVDLLPRFTILPSRADACGISAS